MTDDWLKRMHHGGHAQVLAAVRWQIVKKGNRTAVQPLINLMLAREVQMLKKLDKYYRALSRRLEKGFTDHGETGVLSVFANSGEELNDLVLTSNTRTVGIAGNWQALRLEKGSSEQLSTKRFHQTVEENLEEFLLAEALASVAFVMQTDRSQAAKIIARGIEEGLGQREISKNLQQSFSGRFGKGHAATIARTEVGIAGSKGQDQGARILGAQQKLWVAVDDDRTRGHHNDVDNKRVKIDEFFTPLGENMSHPHDGAHGATAKNIVNCRCAVLYD